MKIKYLTLSKEEKKMAKRNFLTTSTGKYIKKQITSALICAILCTGIAIYIIVDAYLKDMTMIYKIYGFIILGFGLAGIIASRQIFLKKINEYITRNK